MRIRRRIRENIRRVTDGNTPIFSSPYVDVIISDAGRCDNPDARRQSPDVVGTKWGSQRQEQTIRLVRPRQRDKIIALQVSIRGYPLQASIKLTLQFIWKRRRAQHPARPVQNSPFRSAAPS